MTRIPFRLTPMCTALMIAGLLAACGGGGDGSSSAAAPASSQPQASNGTSAAPGGGEIEVGGPGGSAGSNAGSGTGGNAGSTSGGNTGSDGGGSTGGSGSGDPGSGGNNPGTGTGNDNHESTQPIATMMSCADPVPTGSTVVQCSGDAILRSDNGIGVTRSGVQAWARSTRDEAVVAYGLAPAGFASGMRAEVRIARNPATGVAAAPALLLDHLGISWDGHQDRPTIIDTFHGGGESRIELGVHGEIARIALPPSSDIAFYDYATKGTAGTQAHYANNVYFPRSPDNPARCPTYINADAFQCQSESPGLHNDAVGNWRSGGTDPDRAAAMRFHEDGDIHAGNAASGTPPILPGGSGLGAPFPGSKGYRSFDLLGYRYTNLASWFSQDTVDIVEWTGGPGANEHNQNRRGLVSFGEVTDPATVPTSGTVNYSGVAWVWYSVDGQADPTQSTGTATVTVDLATHEATVSLQNTGAGAISGKLQGEASGSNWANYLTGTSKASGQLTGGISARYFGPVSGGTGGTGPAEIGGAFTMTASSGQAVIGGFIALKR